MRLVIVIAVVLHSTAAFARMPSIPEGGVFAGVFGVHPHGTLMDGPVTARQEERFKHRCKSRLDLGTFEIVKTPDSCIEDWRN